MSYRKADVILLGRHSAVKARMSNRIYTVCKSNVDNSPANIGYTSRIFALYAASAEFGTHIDFSCALNICFYGKSFDIISIHRQNAHENLVSHRKSLVCISDPVPRKILRQNRTFHPEGFDANRLFGYRNNTRLNNAPVIDLI